MRCGGAYIHFTAKSNYSKINIPIILLFSDLIMIVTRYMLYQISGVTHFWVRAKSVMTNCPSKMGADCCRGGAIDRGHDYLNSYPYPATAAAVAAHYSN